MIFGTIPILRVIACGETVDGGTGDLVADLYADQTDTPMFGSEQAPLFAIDKTLDMFGVMSKAVSYHVNLDLPAISERRRLWAGIVFTPISAHARIEWRTYGPSPMFPDDESADMFDTSESTMFQIDSAAAMFSANSADEISTEDALWPGPEWSESRVWSGQLEAPEKRLYQFRVYVPSMSGSAPRVSVFRIVSDVPEIREVLNDISISAQGSRLPLAKSFASVDHISLIIQETGETDAIGYRFIDLEPYGPMIQLFDGSGTPVAGLVDASVIGVPLLA